MCGFCGDLNDVKWDKKTLDIVAALHLVHTHTGLDVEHLSKTRQETLRGLDAKHLNDITELL